MYSVMVEPSRRAGRNGRIARKLLGSFNFFRNSTKSDAVFPVSYPGSGAALSPTA